ncbi:general substrate transporter [Coniochaeta sp. PMI_546]|nr:general substrate transporter [Coniochaeta sp. PMI_546]
MAPNVDKETIRANWRCFVACGFMLVTPFQYGLDFGLIGGLQAMPGFLQVFGYKSPSTPSGWNITPERQQLISSLMTLGAFLSSGTAGFVAAKLGRKMCLWLACLLCVVSDVIMMTTTDIGALYAGRFLIGLANGYFMTFSQLYIQESSPAKYRGLFLAVFQFCTSMGTLIGTIVDWATAKRPDKSAYLIPLGIIYAVPIVLSVALIFIPESPRWLINKDRHEAGVASLKWLRPDGADVQAEADDIRSAIERERELSSSVGFIDMFKNPIDRRRTVLSVCAVTLQAASGSMFIIAYKAYFFTMAKVADPFAMSCVLSAVGLLALIINACIVVKFGRRRVLTMNGLIICGFLQLIVAVVYDKKPGEIVTGQVLVAMSCLYMMSYSGLIASYAWLAGGEIPSQRLRSYTFGLAAAVGFFAAWLTTFTAPYFINPASLNWGPKYGYIWFPSCLIGALWVFFFLPETKGRTLEEIDEIFEAKTPARKFRSYQCTGVNLANANLEKRVSHDGDVSDTEKGGAIENVERVPEKSQ